MSGTLHRLARFGLPPTVVGDGRGHPDLDRRPIASAPLEPRAWAELLEDVHRLRLTGMLQAAVSHGSLPVTEPQRAEALDRHLGAVTAVLHLERALLGASALLDAAGLPHVVLKGSAHAHLLYPDASWRVFGDNDLLVRGEHLGEVVEHLLHVGYERPVPELAPGFDARFGKGVTLRHPRGDELDLHRTLLFGTFGLLVDADELFASAEAFEVGGAQLWALGPEARLLHTCYHAALGDPVPRLGALRDVVQAFAGAHDPAEVLRLVAAWGATPVLARALGLCRTHLGVEVLGPVVTATAEHVPTRRDRRAVASYVGGRRSFATKVLASLPYVEGTRAKAAMLRAAVLPRRALRRSVGAEAPASWLGRGLRTLSGRRRGGHD